MVDKFIPETFKVGGQLINVERVHRCESNALGNCCVPAGSIEIADMYNKEDAQTESAKVNTFFHELTHSILVTMGKKELNEDEEFVSTFSSFLCEAMTTAKYKDDKDMQ